MFLGTVRRKLTALVGFSALAAIAVLPILWWLMHHELIDQARERVPDVVNGLERGARGRHRGSRCHRERDRAVRLQDATDGSLRQECGLDEVVKPFRTAYPDLDMLVFGADRKLVAQYGCENPQKLLPTSSRSAST